MCGLSLLHFLSYLNIHFSFQLLKTPDTFSPLLSISVGLLPSASPSSQVFFFMFTAAALSLFFPPLFFLLFSFFSCVMLPCRYRHGRSKKKKRKGYSFLRCCRPFCPFLLRFVVCAASFPFFLLSLSLLSPPLLSLFSAWSLGRSFHLSSFFFVLQYFPLLYHDTFGCIPSP